MTYIGGGESKIANFFNGKLMHKLFRYQMPFNANFALIILLYLQSVPFGESTYSTESRYTT